MENYQFNYTPFTAEDVREGQRSPFGSLCPNSHCFFNPKNERKFENIIKASTDKPHFVQSIWRYKEFGEITA